MSKKNRCIISGVDVSQLSFGFNEDSHECQEIKNKLLNAIVTLHNNGVDEFFTNCDFGFPLWGGEIVAGLMNYNDVFLYVYYPYENQPYKYAQNWQDRFYKVHEVCTDVISVFIDFDEDGKTIFLHESDEVMERLADDYMLDVCGKLLFCGNGDDSYIFKQALERKLEVIVLDLEVT